VSDFREPLKVMHLHNRPHFKLQDDDVTCSLQSVGIDLEELPVSVDVKDLQKLVLLSRTRSLPARSAMSYTMAM
jgi:hypothetical protein